MRRKSRSNMPPWQCSTTGTRRADAAQVRTPLRTRLPRLATWRWTTSGRRTASCASAAVTPVTDATDRYSHEPWRCVATTVRSTSSLHRSMISRMTVSMPPRPAGSGPAMSTRTRPGTGTPSARGAGAVVGRPVEPVGGRRVSVILAHSSRRDGLHDIADAELSSPGLPGSIGEPGPGITAIRIRHPPFPPAARRRMAKKAFGRSTTTRSGGVCGRCAVDDGGPWIIHRQQSTFCLPRIWHQHVHPHPMTAGP